MTITEIVQCIMDGGEVPASAALGAVEARALLNVAAADRSSLVRSEAVEALEQQGDTSSLPVLTKRLQDRYPGIRLAAKQAIGAIKRRTTSKQSGLS